MFVCFFFGGGGRGRCLTNTHPPIHPNAPTYPRTHPTAAPRASTARPSRCYRRSAACPERGARGGACIGAGACATVRGEVRSWMNWNETRTFLYCQPQNLIDFGSPPPPPPPSNNTTTQNSTTPSMTPWPHDPINPTTAPGRWRSTTRGRPTTCRRSGTPRHVDSKSNQGGRRKKSVVVVVVDGWCSLD